MNATIVWLDRAKERAGLRSDYQLAKALNTSTARIANYRAGTVQAMDDDLAVAVASLCKVPPALILCELHAERSRNPATRAAWQHMGQLAKAVAALSLIFCAILTAPRVDAATTPLSDTYVFYPALAPVSAGDDCILCSIFAAADTHITLTRRARFRGAVRPESRRLRRFHRLKKTPDRAPPAALVRRGFARIALPQFGELPC